MNERLVRLIGEDNLNKLKNTSILLVGVGGVGGFTLESLVRSGIGNITIFDGDKFENSNLNRQILSNTNNIGHFKASEALLRAKSINPDIIIKNNDMFLNEANINQLENYDYIIDACDDVNAKILLIKYALDNNIKIISCMGTGKRLDPSKIEISRLDKTYNDPLAKVMRSKLKKAGISTKIPVVYSKELPLNNDNIVSSCIIVPATAGIYLASYVINDIINN